VVSVGRHGYNVITGTCTCFGCSSDSHRVLDYDMLLLQQMAGKLSVDTFEALLDVLEKATGMAQPVAQAQAELLFMSKLGMDKRAYQVRNNSYYIHTQKHMSALQL
jgi:hypothetical protein